MAEAAEPQLSPRAGASLRSERALASDSVLVPRFAVPFRFFFRQGFYQTKPFLDLPCLGSVSYNIRESHCQNDVGKPNRARGDATSRHRDGKSSDSQMPSIDYLVYYT